jgi:hypothetical protein
MRRSTEFVITVILTLRVVQTSLVCLALRMREQVCLFTPLSTHPGVLTLVDKRLVLFMWDVHCEFCAVFVAQVPNRYVPPVDGVSSLESATTPENGPIPSTPRNAHVVNQNSNEGWTSNKSVRPETNAPDLVKPPVALTNGPSSNSVPGDFKLMCHPVVKLDRLASDFAQLNENRPRRSNSSTTRNEDHSGSESEDGSPKHKIFRAKGKEREESKRKGKNDRLLLFMT